MSATDIRVMLVDDSSIVRSLMQRALEHQPDIRIVATATNGQEAIQSVRHTPADIIVLDIEMPIMDGLTALPELLKACPGVRVIIASTLSLRNAEISMRAMALGASDYLAKPSAANPDEIQIFYRDLVDKIRALSSSRSPAVAASAPVTPYAPVPAAPAVSTPAARPAVTPASTGPKPPAWSLQEAYARVPRASAIAIASSTGGPQALLALFGALKGRSLTVPIFITQHMPANFTTILAEHITRTVEADCHEGKDGEEVKTGTIYLAPGDYHMVVERQGITTRIRLNQNPPENFCRPAADPMLRSLAAVYGQGLVTVVLTGMGSDGALGAAEVVKQGGVVAAQNEATCVVYGMPKAVADAGVASAILPLDQMAPYLLRAMGM